MTKPKLMSTSAPPPSGGDGCSEEKLFEEPRARNRAPGLLDGMDVFLHLSDLEQIGVGWTRQYINQLEAEGKFPRRVHLSGNTVAWLKSEVIAWQGERSAMRGAAPAPKAPPAGQPPTEKKLPAKKKPATKLPARQKDQGGRKVAAEADDVRAAG